MQVEIIEGLFLGQVFPVVQVGHGEHEGQYFLQVGMLDNGEKRGSWFDVARCRVITDDSYKFSMTHEELEDLVTARIAEHDALKEQPKKRGQRGKGKKEAAVPVSMRIPADVLKMIDDKAAFNGMDRTAMILSILSKGY